MAVVGLDDLDVVARGQRPGRRRAFEASFTPTLMLGRKDDGRLLRGSGDGLFCSAVKPVVPITALTPTWARHGQMLQGALRAGEVDQHVGVGQARADPQ